MIKILYKTSFLIILAIITSCNTSFSPTPITNTSLSVDINLSASHVTLGEQLIVSIDVQNADSLYALSFVLNYTSSMFDIDSIISGNLFVDPFMIRPDETNTELSISVQPGDIDSIQGTVNGTACLIYLKSKAVGTDILYISSIHMIKSNGDFIDEFDVLSITTKEGEVMQ